MWIETYHAFDEIECSHANRHVGVVDAAENRLMVRRNEMRMCWQNLDERNESNVSYCSHSQ
jgi:hypothetical protein